jgi:hypothetical protein
MGPKCAIVAQQKNRITLAQQVPKVIVERHGWAQWFRIILMQIGLRRKNDLG